MRPMPPRNPAPPLKQTLLPRRTPPPRQDAAPEDGHCPRGGRRPRGRLCHRAGADRGRDLVRAAELLRRGRAALLPSPDADWGRARPARRRDGGGAHGPGAAPCGRGSRRAGGGVFRRGAPPRRRRALAVRPGAGLVHGPALCGGWARADPQAGHGAAVRGGAGAGQAPGRAHGAGPVHGHGRGGRGAGAPGWPCRPPRRTSAPGPWPLRGRTREQNEVSLALYEGDLFDALPAGLRFPLNHLQPALPYGAGHGEPAAGGPAGAGPRPLGGADGLDF